MVSNIFYFHPYLGKWSNLTNIFQMGWNHQLGNHWFPSIRPAMKTLWIWGDCPPQTCESNLTLSNWTSLGSQLWRTQRVRFFRLKCGLNLVIQNSSWPFFLFPNWKLSPENKSQPNKHSPALAAPPKTIPLHRFCSTHQKGGENPSEWTRWPTSVKHVRPWPFARLYRC